jgi:hypothetical protein
MSQHAPHQDDRELERARRGSTMLERSVTTVTYANEPIVRMDRILDDRAASSPILVKQKRSQLAQLRASVVTLLELAQATGHGMTQTVTAAEEAIRRIDRIDTRLRAIARRGESRLLWLLLGGESGNGKSTFLRSATAVPDVVPSRGGKPVTGATVRVCHDPRATTRLAQITLDSGNSLTVPNHEIDAWISQHDGDNQSLTQYQAIVDAEIRVAFRNPLAEMFAFIDSAGMVDGQDLEERQFTHAVDHASDVLLIIDQPNPDNGREVLSRINFQTYAIIDRMPTLVVVNRTSLNRVNCQLRHDELLNLGVPASRIITADCASTSEVNDVLLTILEWFLEAEG